MPDDPILKTADEFIQDWELHGEILDAIPDAVIVDGPHDLIKIVNQTAEMWFGYSRHELFLQPVEILLPEDIRETHREHRARYRTNPSVRQMGSGLKLQGRHSSGVLFPVDIYLAPRMRRDGLYIVSTIRRLDRADRGK